MADAGARPQRTVVVSETLDANGLCVVIVDVNEDVMIQHDSTAELRLLHGGVSHPPHLLQPAVRASVGISGDGPRVVKCANPVDLLIASQEEATVRVESPLSDLTLSGPSGLGFLAVETPAGPARFLDIYGRVKLATPGDAEEIILQSDAVLHRAGGIRTWQLTLPPHAALGDEVAATLTRLPESQCAIEITDGRSAFGNVSMYRGSPTRSFLPTEIGLAFGRCAWSLGPDRYARREAVIAIDTLPAGVDLVTTGFARLRLRSGSGDGDREIVTRRLEVIGHGIDGWTLKVDAMRCASRMRSSNAVREGSAG